MTAAAGEVTVNGGGGTTGVRATARIAARVDGRGGTALPVLESDGPLALRRTRGSGDEARVMLVGAMSGPLGGDRFAVEVEVGEGARLRVGSAAATIALPGQAKGEAQYGVRIDVAAGGELRWLPEQLISVKGSDLRVSTRVELAVGARLVFREEQVLGRAGRSPGGSPAGSVCGRAGGRCSISRWGAGRGLPAAGTGPPCWAGSGPWGNSSSYGPSSPIGCPSRGCWGRVPRSHRSPDPPYWSAPSHPTRCGYGACSTKPLPSWMVEEQLKTS